MRDSPTNTGFHFCLQLKQIPKSLIRTAPNEVPYELFFKSMTMGNTDPLEENDYRTAIDCHPTISLPSFESNSHCSPDKNPCDQLRIK